MKWVVRFLLGAILKAQYFRAFLLWVRYVPIEHDAVWTENDASKLHGFLYGDETGKRLNHRLFYFCHSQDRSAQQKSNNAQWAAGFAAGCRATHAEVMSWSEVDSGSAAPPQVRRTPQGFEEVSGAETLRELMAPL